MSVGERLRVLRALMQRVITDAFTTGTPSRHVLMALANYAASWADELEDR